MSSKVTNAVRTCWPEIAAAVLTAAACAYLYLRTPSARIILIGVAGILVAVLFAVSRLRPPRSGRHGAADALGPVVRVFPVALLAVCVTSAAIWPPSTIPDEPSHYRTAYLYANLLTGQDADTIRNCDDDFMRMLVQGGEFSVQKWENVGSYLSSPADMTVTHDPELMIEADYWGNDHLPNTLANIIQATPPQLKVGGAVGIAVGRALGLNPAALFYLGRITTLALVVALVTLAVRLTPVDKTAFMTVAFLPMTVHLVGSYSSDGMVIAFGMLLLALYLRAILLDGSLERSTAGGILVLTFLLAPCKLVYTPLALLTLLIPRERFGSRRSELLFKAGVLLFTVAGVLVLRGAKLLSLAGAGQETSLDRRGDEQGHFYTLSWLVAHPSDAAQLCLRGLQVDGISYLRGMVGGDLGWQTADIAASPLFVVVLYALLALSLSNPPSATKHLKPVARVVMLIVFVAVFGLILVGELTIWTFDTEPYVLGVQGRYFLPALPVLLVAATPQHLASNVLTTRVPEVMCSSYFVYLAWICMRVML